MYLNPSCKMPFGNFKPSRRSTVTKIFLFLIFLFIVASEAKRPYKNDENFLNNWLPDHHKLYLIYFYKSWARPGGGSVQILCYRTPPRPLGISKRHFTGRKMVVWGWFMYIFINLSLFYDHFLIFICFYDVSLKYWYS